MEKKSYAKMMPHSIEAEQAILGCCLIDENVPIDVMAALNANDFYVEAHKQIFDAMMSIYSNNVAIDFVTITDQLEKNNLLESVGGIDYITTLTNIIPSAANFKHYLDIVKRCSVLRKLISSSQKIIENSYESESAEDAIGFAEKEIFDIASKQDTSSLEQMENALNKVIEKLDLIAKDKNALKGISTGYTDFDAITNGLQNSDLILLAARPGVGKTSFAMNIVNYAATKGKKKCAVFSLEMPKTQIAQRSLFSVANVSMEKGLKGELSVDEWKSLWAAKKELAESGIYVDDSSMNKATDILSKCRRLKREKGLDLVMIDYLQLMTGSSKNSSENRQQEISEITRSLKIAARELDVPIILLSQLSRAVESRKDHRPMLSDLRESGANEQDADIVLFIYKPDMYNDVVNEDEPNTCEVIIAKHRNGPIGTVKLKWVGEYTKFVNLKDYTKIARQNVQSSAGQEPVEPVLEPVQKVDLENMEDLW